MKVPQKEVATCRRTVIERVTPEIDAGRFPIKRVPGDEVRVTCKAFTDGHDLVTCVLRWREEGKRTWNETPMQSFPNDEWEGAFVVPETGDYEYTLRAWVDRFGSWRRDILKKIDVDQEVPVDMLVGAGLVRAAAERAKGPDKKALEKWADTLEKNKDAPNAERLSLVSDPELSGLAHRYPDTSDATDYPRILGVHVDRPRARFSAWYEFFPRSTGEGMKHGTFADAERMLPYIKEMGFDVVYLPPIHPIGRTNRKGKNNALKAGPDDVGSPWGIGAKEGGHTAVHPQLGTLEDFRRFREKAEKLGLELALDIAFQCTPDHPWVKEHPSWFKWLPDGTIQYAENPPKKYQDIYPFNFENEDWCALWEALRDVMLYWVEQGVKIFRVDNPHTKPFRFWEWAIGEIQAQHPEVLFLSEAFTRPGPMYHLAKLGFTQSYTYFAWRNTKRELTEYMEELTTYPVRDIYRPNFWPNTPDILTEFLQTGGRPAFISRFVLAATLSSNYGIYGPAFELCEGRPMKAGSEEYLDSEKYQIRDWDLEASHSLRPIITRINAARRENPALQRTDNVRFLRIDNDEIIAYAKESVDKTNRVICIVNMSPHHTHSGWVELPLAEWGIGETESYEVDDLLSGERYLWSGPWNYVELNPEKTPAHVLLFRRRTHTEADFPTY